MVAFAALNQAYCSTAYTVYALGASLRIGSSAPPEIDACLKELGANFCAFLTAWNPASVS